MSFLWNACGGLLSGGDDSTLAASFSFVAATVACTVGAGMVLLQTDTVSRKILSIDSLAAKRWIEYRYRWTQALERASWRVRYAYFKSQKISYSDEVEVMQTQFLHADDVIDGFVARIVKGIDSTGLRIGRIGKDDRQQPSYESSDMEYYVWFYEVAADGEQNFAIYQLPLTSFATKLANAFERQITSVTFCFVTDASAGISTKFIMDMLSCNESLKKQLLIVDQPLWLVELGQIIQGNKGQIAKDTLQHTLFALCRFEAMKCIKGQHTTCLFNVGSSIVPMITPLAQSVFPNDRHVFAYTGCVQTVLYALQAPAHDKSRGYIPPTLEDSLNWDHSIISTTPLDFSLSKSTNVMKPYMETLSQLPINLVSIVETWMKAVDTFFVLKADEKQNGYLPYTCKLDYMLEMSLDRYLSIRSLIQYVTGSKSREMPTDIMDDITKWVAEYAKEINRQSVSQIRNSQKAEHVLVQAYRKEIENTVFQHKLILIENKTLQDTVQPAEHWTLKQSVKRGCTCCAPEDDEDEEEEAAAAAEATKKKNGGGMGTISSTTFLPPSVAATVNNNNTASKPKKSNAGRYVDGKTTFAFDPTRFS